MNVSEMSALVLSQVDDPAGQGFTAATVPNTTPPEILAALNEGQVLASWLTLCLEATATFPLNGSTFYLPRPPLTDFLVPLRFTYGGARIRPATIAEMEAENDGWQATAGTPARYACLGFNFLIVTPQVTGSASMTYARSPVPLVNDADVPELLESYHQDLVDYAVYKVRLKEGAQGLVRGLKRLTLFLDDMQRLGDYIRARSVAARYDVLPLEMALLDRSRLVRLIKTMEAKQNGG
jgi:hypothetical protein